MKITPAKLILWCACVIAAASLLFVAFQYDQKHFSDTVDRPRPIEMVDRGPGSYPARTRQEWEQKRRSLVGDTGPTIRFDRPERIVSDSEYTEQVAQFQREASQQNQKDALLAACSFDIPNSARVVTIVAEGNTLSNVSIAGQDRETWAISLDLEAGGPLVLALYAHKPTIWKINGEKSRILKIISTEKNGIAGVDRSRIDFSKKCLNQVMAGPAEAVPKGQINSVTIGSGPARFQEIVSPSPNAGDDFDPVAWEQMLRFVPGGVSAFKPDDVVALIKPVFYIVMPHQAGIAQLLRQGVLEPVGSKAMLQVRRDENGKAFAVKENIYAALKIVRNTPRFPSGMCGAHREEFILGRGVMLPAGDVCHSCVRREDNNEIAAGHCR